MHDASKINQINEFKVENHKLKFIPSLKKMKRTSFEPRYLFTLTSCFQKQKNSIAGDSEHEYG